MSSERRAHFEAVWRSRSQEGTPGASGVENIRVAKALQILGHGARLLDIGCGSGELGERALGRFSEVHGLDVSSGAVDAARQRGVRAVVVDAGAEPLPYEDATFDAVTAMSMLQLVPDVPALLAQCRRVLRPGGQFVLSVPNMRAVWRLWKLAILGEFPRTSHDTAGLDGGTVHYFTCRSICGLLERSGFDIAGLYGIHCRPRWMEHRARTPFGRGVKREFFSGEVLVDARVASLQAPARSLL